MMIGLTKIAKQLITVLTLINWFACAGTKLVAFSVEDLTTKLKYGNYIMPGLKKCKAGRPITSSWRSLNHIIKMYLEEYQRILWDFGILAKLVSDNCFV